MEPASALRPLSFKKDPRTGQQDVFDSLATHKEQLNIKLPTGYGKTFTCCGVYSLLKRAGRVNRLLVIFPTDKQLDQFVADAPLDDLPRTLVDGPLQCVDIRKFGVRAIKLHRSNERQIFVITVQSLIQSTGWAIVLDLLQTGLWMITVDEHHHYGEEKIWGKTVQSLNRQFLLVMSATPHRPAKDGAFGAPHINVSYEQAYKEGAVKELHGHAYHYDLDIEIEGTIHHYTTRQLAEEAGGDEADKIEKLRIERRMRWAPKFISPLISIPIDRMLSERLRTGQPLQVLITAICVSHAEYVCGQIREMYPELRVDWIGTGSFGRDEEINKEILARFCPPKGPDGKRPDPKLDICVHVGMAGEGLDSILVSEVVHLSNATMSNRINQINGRAARYLPGVIGHISFDASSEFAQRGYLGGSIMRAMDDLPPYAKDRAPPDDDEKWPPPPPEDPDILIVDLEFKGVDSGDAGVQSFARFMEQRQPALYPWQDMKADNAHPEWDPFIDDYKKFRARETELFNDSAVLAQWKAKVITLLSETVGLVTKRRRKKGQFVDGFIVGKIAHRINSERRALFGELNERCQDIETAKQHYGWLFKLNMQLREQGIPEWLDF